MEASATAPAASAVRIAQAAVLAQAERTASVVAISHAAAPATGMPSEAVPEGSMAPTRAAIATAAPPVCDRAAVPIAAAADLIAAVAGSIAAGAGSIAAEGPVAAAEASVVAAAVVVAVAE